MKKQSEIDEECIRREELFLSMKQRGKRDYIEWEKNMEEWFHDHHILREKRLAYAISQLTGDAYKWWVQEVDNRWYNKEPTITSWRDLKELLRNKYAPKASNRSRKANVTAQGLAVQEKKKALVPYSKKNPIAKEQFEDEVLKILNAYNKPKKAKCVLTSNSEKVKFALPSKFEKDTCDLFEKPDFVLKNDQPCDKLILSKPLQASSTFCFSQVLEEKSHEEESPNETQRCLPLISHFEQPPQFVPKSVLMPFPCDYPRKHCKEIDLVKTKPNLFMLVSAQDEKCFVFENVKEFCVSKSVFDKMIPNFEAFTLEEFFKQKGLLFDDFHEFNSSLRISLCSNAFELFKSKDEYAMVKALYELKHVLKNVSCDSNPFIELCNPIVNDHILEFSISSIMHLFCPMSAQKGTGAMEKYKYLGEVTSRKDSFKVQLQNHDNLKGAEGALNILTIKEKPPDLYLPQFLRKERKQGTMSRIGELTQAEEVRVHNQLPRAEYSSVIKEKPPDAKPPIKTRGNYLNSQKRMKANLLSLGEGCTIWRPIKKTTDREISTHHMSQSRDRREDYQNQHRLKHKEERIGKQSNLFVRASKDYEDMLSEDKPIGLPPIHDASQSHVWRPGDYLGRSSPTPHEILVFLLHMFPEEPKMDLSSFGSFHTYQWRPGEFLDTFRENNLVTNNALIQEEPPDPTPLPLILMISSTEHTITLIQASSSLTRFVSHVSRTVTRSLSHLGNIEKELELFKENLEPNSCLRTQVKHEHFKDNALIKVEPCLLVYSDSMTMITHLFFAKAVEDIAGIKEEPPDLEILSSNLFERTGIGVDLMPKIDYPFNRTRRKSDNAYELELQGKYNMSSSFNDSYLVLFIVGELDLRSNPFQVGEDDVFMESTKDLELDKELVPEEAPHESEEQLVPEEVLIFPAGPITRSRSKRFNQAINGLLRELEKKQEDVAQLSLVMITAQGVR
ncbi:uncharacterized protein LOC9318218 isoform X2 [Arabidopsis lyrata subsp. lyrata]|uniref:uncharacterized protein LOC9318218 isoform X2 n=1 Tax=Arabidopsis lyrata subsp. lyrata TaxID=81972 RepID=UPI000A29AB24|nr:uncharacterized protein LOC9318218 isoform X2 [Arabidopsis lyrata subsp. lyrata]XP_020884968.1 uncharacterized protein LOC9318218 isoform X2 [Arabidopsis lyrata subsp. lyrata]XP_020884969.1 uncharacterized protein LOC9318218 isoform X2 [Arabidopsis lyrata subsp. lyrata]XP_020884970.1 uncharacterized protein LOC9318218 isoform X2 [Arabidopsis lyrata subsp. lyrata]|eukprot:XP_020884967.1 uncharacterized protein LOC9318218 isoform X2 [Arabidopsis lyrata subsp. lyrata]